MPPIHGLVATPLASWERECLKAALVKAGLPADDVAEPGSLFWRFETRVDIPAGFGGLEMVKRTGEALYVGASRPRGSNEVRTLVSIRPGAEHGRRAVGELRAGVLAKGFSAIRKLSDEELQRYRQANVGAVAEVAALVDPDVALANHAVMGPLVLHRGLAGRTPYAVKIHGSALEYTVRRDPERYLPYAREGVDRDGHPLLIMPSDAFHRLSDEDVQTVVAYLRSQPAVNRATPSRDVNLLGLVLVGAGLFPTSEQPHIAGPQTAPPSDRDALVCVWLCADHRR